MRFSQHHKTAHSKRYKKLGQQVNHPTDFQKREEKRKRLLVTFQETALANLLKRDSNRTKDIGATQRELTDQKTYLKTSWQKEHQNLHSLFT
jgi:hypothetical protein